MQNYTMRGLPYHIFNGSSAAMDAVDFEQDSVSENVLRVVSELFSLSPFVNGDWTAPPRANRFPPRVRYVFLTGYIRVLSWC